MARISLIGSAHAMLDAMLLKVMTYNCVGESEVVRRVPADEASDPVVATLDFDEIRGRCAC